MTNALRTYRGFDERLEALQRFLRPTIERVSNGFIVVCKDCGPSALIRHEVGAARVRYCHEYLCNGRGWPENLRP